jgi:hypothetical protein
MSKRKSSKRSGYKIGYAQPPKSTQFKPGKSGNPRGRPKGSRGLATIMQEVMNGKIDVAEGGRNKRLSAFEVMLKKLRNDAIRGDKQAFKLLLPLFERYAGSVQAKQSLKELLDEDQKILAEYLPDSDDFTGE